METSENPKIYNNNIENKCTKGNTLFFHASPNSVLIWRSHLITLWTVDWNKPNYIWLFRTAKLFLGQLDSFWLISD